MTDLTIGEGTQVTLNFALKLENGDVIDSNLGQEPATFVVGDGNLLPGFEKALQGLKAGTNDTFVIKPEDGFGQRNSNNIQEMPRNQFSDELELVEGLMLSFADAQSAELPGLVVAFDEKTVTVDFNHPLAGRNILFEVAIVDVQPAVTH